MFYLLLAERRRLKISIIRNILVRVGADIRPLQTNMVQAQRSMTGFRSVMRTATSNTRLSVQSIVGSLGMGRLAFVALGVASIAAFALVGKNSIKAAMDVVESESLFNVSMGSMGQAARDWSNQLQDSLGLNAYEVRKNVGLFYNMTTSMGLARDQAYQVSTGLTQLAYDMSSFYNQSPDEMFAKLQSGLSGEVEPLKRLGIIVNETTTKNYAYAHGIAKVGSELTETQKIMARYGAITDQTKNAQGDLARTITSPANQLRLLQTQLQMASINLGNAFMPIVTIVLPILTGFAKGLVQVTNTFSQFMSVLFGTNKTQEQTAVSAADAAAAQTDLGDSAKKAGDKAKKSIAGFDQLNLLQKNLSENAGGATDALDGGSTMPNPSKQDSNSIIPKGIIDAANRFKLALAPLMAISFQPLIDSFARLRTALQPFKNTIFQGLVWFYDKILVPLATWTIQDALPAFLNALAGAATILNPLLLSFKPVATWLWENFLLPIAKWTGGIIVSVLNGLGNELTFIGNWMSGHQSVISGITTTVLAFMAAWKIVEILAFIQTSGGVIQALKGIAVAIYEGIAAKLADKLSTLGLAATYIKNLIVAIADATLAFLAKTVAVLAAGIAIVGLTVIGATYAIATGISTAATWLFNAALAVLTSPITLVISALALLGVGIYLLVKNWDKVKEVGAATWESIKGVWAKASEWFSTHVVDPIKNLFSGLWDGVGSIFKGIANTMIDAINYLIDGLNKINFSMPDWMPDSLGGGKNFGVNISEIPHLANGGLVSSPQLALVGDNKNAYTDPEIVSPLSKLQEIIGRSISLSMGSNRGNGGGDATVILQLGETELGRAVIKSINSLQRQAGRTLIDV